MNTQFQVVVPQTQQPEMGKNLLYVSDLPVNVTESDLWMFFEEYKDNIVVININVSSRQSEYNPMKSPSATVIFRDFKIADNARRGLNMKKLKGKTIRVVWHDRDNSSRYNSMNNLFIKNIPSEVKPREFYEFFLQFGDIASAKLPEDDDGSHLGYGYINYVSPQSAQLAIKEADGKEAWGGRIEVKNFQKKNERFDSLSLKNTNIYLKNFPTEYKEKDLESLCKQFGEVVHCKIYHDQNERNYAIVSYKDEDSAVNAKSSLNGSKVEEVEIYVDTLMNKQDRKKLLNTQIKDYNYRINEQTKYCNLHIRNIPYNAKEEDLMEAFKSFGDIKSVKIDKYMLVTKANNEFIEIPTSKGFGYVCFESPEAAAAAKEEMDGKFLPKFETWKRPLLVDFFMPKHERNQQMSKYSQIGGAKNNMYNPNMIPGMNPMMMNPMMMNPNMQFSGQGGKGMRFPQQVPQQMNPNYMQQGIPQNVNQGYQKPQKSTKFDNQQQKIPQQTQQPIVEQPKDDIDYKYLKSLDDDYAKKDYLGEHIFKKIENHKMSQENNFTIDTIGKITGMILGIDDINEIIQICRDPLNLTGRIKEALELLNA